ncbi:MAG: tetratricopeptide repeat protein [Planctomycetes bacterium]|nr:tetratricopeptide repeat protein [Planctomycetota bacterium]
MKTLALLAALLVSASAFAEDGAAEDYARALDRENTDRDLNGALEIYKSIVKKHRDEEEIAAKAQYRMGECWEKLGVTADAKQAYEELIRDFPGQANLVDKAKERLGAISGAPAAVTPEERTRKILEKTRIDLDFNDSAITDVLDFISSFAHVPCLVDPQAGELATKQITFAVKDLPLSKVIDLLAETSHFACVNWNGILVWTTPERAALLKQMPTIAAENGAPADDAKVERAINSIRISLNFSETPLAESLSFIREVSDLNVVLDEKCPNSNVSLRIEDTRLGDVLSLLAFMNKLEIFIKNGALVVKGK